MTPEFSVVVRGGPAVHGPAAAPARPTLGRVEVWPVRTNMMQALRRRSPDQAMVEVRPGGQFPLARGPLENWGIRGGTPASDVDLGFEVGV
jgi:hypothetical protein